MRSGLIALVCSVALLSAPLLHTPAEAQWMPNGTGYCTTINDQLDPVLCPADSGGTILVWTDSRAGVFTFDLFAQRVDSLGRPRWAIHGVPVCTAAGDQLRPVVTSDGAGGAVIAWEDTRNGNLDIFVQRLNASGNRVWATDGVPVCADPEQQTSVVISPSTGGGAIVVWEDDRGGLGPDIYGQRVNGSGAVQWTAGGLGLCTADEDQFEPSMISDGSGGAILTWFDFRTFDFDIYALRVNTSGGNVWTPNGVLVCGAVGTQRVPVLAPDSSGGAIVAWEDFRDEIESFDIYVQRVNFSGARVWTADGVVLCANPSDQTDPVVASDGSGGAYVVWTDDRVENADIYARRISSAGVPQWAQDGVPVVNQIGTQESPNIIPGAAGSAIVMWEDLRTSIFNVDLYVQRIGPTGTLLWPAAGVAMTAAGTDQVSASLITDGVGGAIAVWEDARAGSSADIYAQRVDALGRTAPNTVDVPLERRISLELSEAHPNPCRIQTALRFALPAGEAVCAEVLDLSGRRVRELARNQPLHAGVHTLKWDVRDEQGEQVRAGVYWLRISTPAGAAARRVTVLP